MKFNLERVIIGVMCLIIAFASYRIYGSGLNFSTFGNAKAVNPTEPFQNTQSSKALLDAEQSYQRGDYQDAMDKYQAILPRNDINDKQYIYIYNRLAMCYLNLENYEKASQTFLEILKYDKKNATAYNNAAVAEYYAGNYENAQRMLGHATEILPVAEYYYNLARICEAQKDYAGAIQNLSLVSNAANNLTKISPQAIQTRLNHLTDGKTLEKRTAGMMPLRLKDPSTTLVLPDTPMTIQSSKYILTTNLEVPKKHLNASYDRDANDPYHLIQSLQWTLTRNGLPAATQEGVSFQYTIETAGIYELQLTLQLKNGQTEVSSKNIVITTAELTAPDQGASVEAPKPSVPPTITVPKPSPELKQYYTAADYEQLFTNAFQWNTSDNAGVVWSQTGSLTTELRKNDNIDRGNSLYLANKGHASESLQVDLTSLLTTQNLRGKKIRVSFYAKRLSADENMTATVKAGSTSITNQNFYLSGKYKSAVLPITIPTKCNSLTVTITLAPGDEIVIDGFTMTAS